MKDFLIAPPARNTKAGCSERPPSAAAKADNPFMELCGVLPKDEVRRLKKILAEQRQIDEEMWK
jgi:hypothetical protein